MTRTLTQARPTGDPGATDATDTTDAIDAIDAKDATDTTDRTDRTGITSTTPAAPHPSAAATPLPHATRAADRVATPRVPASRVASQIPASLMPAARVPAARVPAPRTAAPRITAGRIAVTPAAGIPPASPLSALLRRQQGVLSAAQAAAHGLAHETLRQRVLRGIWQRLLPGVYALQCGPPTWRQWLIAALVYAGDGSMLTGSAALLEHAIPAPVTPAGPQPPRVTTVTHTIPELPQSIATTPGSATSTPPPPLPTRIDVLLPHRTRRQSIPGTPGVPGVRVIRATRLPTPTESGPIRLAPPARAVIDACFAAAACGDTSAVEATADQVLRSGQASLADLEAELARAPRRHSSHLRNHLARLREQARTTAAKRLAAAADSLGARQGHGDGNPLRDVVLYSDRLPVARAAALWPTRAVAAAVDAPSHELESLKRLGFAVIQVSPHSVDGDLPGVLRRIGGVLKERPEAVLPAGVSMVVDFSSHRRPGLSVS